jgi:hypothetical protein
VPFRYFRAFKPPEKAIVHLKPERVPPLRQAAIRYAVWRQAVYFAHYTLLHLNLLKCKADKGNIFFAVVQKLLKKDALYEEKGRRKG